MRTLTLATFAAALTFIATGCDVDMPSVEQGPEQQVRMLPIDYSAGEINDHASGRNVWLDFDAASLKGDLPTKGAFEQADGYGSLYLDEYEGERYLNLNINVEGDGGWAMVGVNLQIDDDGTAIYRNTDVIGCDDGFDSPAERAEITVEPIVVDGEDFVALTIQGDFPGNTNAVGVVLLPAGE